MPASCNRRTASAAISGVCSAGFATTALPAISAAVTWPRKIASGKFHGEIATKTPRPRSAQHIALAGRARHGLAVAEQFAALRGIIAAEIDGLAHFRERVVQRLAALALQQRDEMRRALLQQVGGLLQNVRARLGRRSAPVLEIRRARLRSPRSPAPASHRRSLAGAGNFCAAIVRDKLVRAPRARRIRCRANSSAAADRDRAAAGCSDAARCRRCR